MAALVVVHMAEVQGSTGVSNEKGTGGNTGRGWYSVWAGARGGVGG